MNIDISPKTESCLLCGLPNSVYDPRDKCVKCQKAISISTNVVMQANGSIRAMATGGGYQKVDRT